MRSPVSIDRTVWAVNKYPWRESEKLAEALGLPLVAAMVLAGRGMTDPAEARKFLDCAFPLPDPFLFSHMEAAVSTISEAIDQGRRIVVHGDYDADGITATALMLLGLRDLGMEAEWYLPSRFKEGYGLSRAAVETIAAEGPAVLVTVDCGINYPEEVALAKEMGLDVVVIDHHQPGPVLPDCHLVHAAVGAYPHEDLCGVGLALKVMHGLHVKRFGVEHDVLPERLEGLLDLVAIGTIADLASLRGENRYYVREGLKLVAIGQRVGLRALALVAGCTGVVDSGAVAYRLAPRLNAAGRLADPSPPLRLLLTEDEREASELAAKLHELNGMRQDVERQLLEEAVARVEMLAEIPPIIVLAGTEWHEGVVGIVASRLVERYHRPAILLGVRDGVAKGSGRSISAYDLMGGLNACADCLTVYGGHTQAAGLTLQADRVDEFRCAIEADAGRALQAADLVPVYRADAVLRGEDINADTAAALASFGPFGSGNPRPRLLVAGASVCEAEATRNGSHLRCAVEVDGVRVRGIGFGMGGLAGSIRESPGRRCIGVQFRMDQWQGTLRPEFVLERVGPSENELDLIRQCGADCGHADPSKSMALEARGAQDPSDEATGTRMPPARGLGGSHGRAGAIAQILATGESVVLATCSVSHALSEMSRSVPTFDPTSVETVCAGRVCGEAREARLASARLAVVDWDVAAAVPAIARDRAHVIALDPPYRARHVAFLRKAGAGGATVHLLYGEEQRRTTEGLLRYLIHPRFAMVCLFRATQEFRTAAEGLVESAVADEALFERRLFDRAAEMAWQEAGVALSWADLARARDILDELGVERLAPGEAKLEARSIPAYAAAEADYEECSRLCLTL